MQGHQSATASTILRNFGFLFLRKDGNEKHFISLFFIAGGLVKEYEKIGIYGDS